MILDPALPKGTHRKQKAKPSLRCYKGCIARFLSVCVGREFTDLPRNNIVSTGTGKIYNEKVDWSLTLFWSASFVKETAFKFTTSSVLLPWNRVFIISSIIILLSLSNLNGIETRRYLKGAWVSKYQASLFSNATPFRQYCRALPVYISQKFLR